MNQPLHRLTLSRTGTLLLLTVVVALTLSPAVHSAPEVSMPTLAQQTSQNETPDQSSAARTPTAQHAAAHSNLSRSVATSPATQRSGNTVLYILVLLLVITLMIAIAYIRALMKADARARHTMTESTADMHRLPASTIVLPQQHPLENYPTPLVAASAPVPLTQPAEEPIEVLPPVIDTRPEHSSPSTPVHPRASHRHNAVDKVSNYVEQSLHSFTDDPLLATMLYHDQLKHAELDYSVASLSRIDRLLIDLREKNTLHISDFINRDDHRTLLTFLGFYVATTIAHITQQTIHWYDYAGLKTYLKNPTMLASLHNSYSCVLGRNNHFMPIELIASILFEPHSRRSCIDQLNYAQQHAQPYAPILRSSQQNVIGADTEQERAWVAAMKLAGQIATKSVYQLKSGALTPMLMYPKNRVQIVTESLIGDEPNDFFERMKHNPQHLAYQAMAYDSSANLPTGTCDALMITSRCYGVHAAEWTVMLPYRSAKLGEDFAIFTPLLAPSTIATYYYPLLMQAFYNGVTMINLPGDPWHSNLQEA